MGDSWGFFASHWQCARWEALRRMFLDSDGGRLCQGRKRKAPGFSGLMVVYDDLMMVSWWFMMENHDWVYFQIHMEVSENGGTPIAGWFLLWKIHQFPWMRTAGTPISENLHIIYLSCFSGYNLGYTISSISKQHLYLLKWAILRW
jgi:hypothetical protein